jgi:hypothetical protein
MRPTPYIGITGFMSRQEVQQVLAVFPEHSPYLAMVGVLVSDKTLRKTPSNPKRYPKGENLKNIFTNHPRALNLLHFNTKEPEWLLDDLCVAHEWAGPLCHGFQLNVAWPNPAALEQYKKQERFGRKIVVLQCGPQALQEVGGASRKLAHRLRQYEGLIDYALIDPSAGTGKEFDADKARNYFRDLQLVLPWLGVGVAGGLRAETLWSQLAPLALSCKCFSIDVESQVRDQEKDELVAAKAIEYLAEAVSFYHRYIET